MAFQHVVSKRSSDQWSLKPQDFLLGLAMALCKPAQISDQQLGFSASGFRDAMARLKSSRLVVEYDGAMHIVLPAFRPFAVFAAPFCWPAVVGGIVRGHRTAFGDGADFSGLEIPMFVWPDVSGECVGRSLLPIHAAAQDAARRDESLGKALNLFDAIRVESGIKRDIAMSQLQLLLK